MQFEYSQPVFRGHVFCLVFQICIHERIVAYVYATLIVERHGSGLVTDTFVLRKIIAVDAKLNEKSSDLKLNVHIGIENQFRERNDGLLSRLLIGEIVFPMESTEMEILPQCCAEHLSASAILSREGILVKINLILNVLDGGRERCVSPGD